LLETLVRLQTPIITRDSDLANLINWVWEQRWS